MTFNDKVLIILTIVATISLGLGLCQDFGQSGRYGGPKVRWVEGVTIMVAVAIVVIVGSLNDYQKERQFIKLNRKVGNPIRASKCS
jgi:P-type Ca2+ transporter type 2C